MVWHCVSVNKEEGMVKHWFVLKARNIETWHWENTSITLVNDTLKSTKPRAKILSMLLEVREIIPFFSSWWLNTQTYQMSSLQVYIFIVRITKLRIEEQVQIIFCLYHNNNWNENNSNWVGTSFTSLACDFSIWDSSWFWILHVNIICVIYSFYLIFLLM